MTSEQGITNMGALKILGWSCIFISIIDLISFNVYDYDIYYEILGITLTGFIAKFSPFIVGGLGVAILNGVAEEEAE